MTDEQRKIRDLTKHLHELTNFVMGYLSELDRIMKEPSTEERGKKIAALSNKLEFANDSARRFGLGIGIKPAKKVRNGK